MSLAFFDTETCGYHGPVILIQYAYDDGPITLHEVWCEPIWVTLQLIEQFCEEEAVVGFNLAFDWFHIQKLHNCLTALADKVGLDAEPRDHIDLYAELESAARDGMCVKPRSAMDLMLYARKGPYQSLMDRKNITIRKVPKTLAPFLVQELDRRVVIKDIFFARKKNPRERWKIKPCKDIKTNKISMDFVDVYLRFAPSSGLKTLAVDAGIADKTIVFEDILPQSDRIEEHSWAPFATAISSKQKGWFGSKHYAWPAVIENHIAHWRFHTTARQYATDDVTYTRALYYHFGSPEHGDEDSILACQVGSSRWRGFSVDLEYLDTLIAKEDEKIKGTPKAPHHVYKYLSEVMSPTERVAFDKEGSTKKVVLESISRMEATCDVCGGAGCPTCGQKGTVKHKAAIRAAAVLDARKGATKKVLYKKLKQAKRLHPSASVIGSLSSRMSGRTEVGDGKKSAGLNALGIQHEKEIRLAFTLAHGQLILSGGDFAGFEVSIADAVYNDPVLRTELLTCYLCKKSREVSQFEDLECPHCGCWEAKCGSCKRSIIMPAGTCSCGNPKPSGADTTLRKLHGLFAMELNEGLTYEEIVATKGSSNDLYDDGKRGVFSQLYGGNADTLVNRIGISKELAELASNNFARKYEGIGRSKKDTVDKFCSMRQPSGLGSKVFWHEPAEYVESLLGFKRYFALENMICKTLFHLADNPPKAWNQIKQVVVRREREQKVGGAVRSAIFAAAFQIQAFNMRAAENHKIQCTGAQICKKLQVRLWRHQPPGVHPWKVQPFNIHDELMTPTHPDIIDEVEQDVKDFVKEMKSLVPLLSIDWTPRMKTWAEK